VESLRGKQFGPRYVESTRWNLHMNLAKEDAFQTKDCYATIQFDIRNTHPNTANRIKNENENETVAVEFSHEDLSEFFTKINLIQRQLDGLT